MIRRSTSKTPMAIYCWFFQVALVLVLASVVAWLSLIPKSPSFAISNFRIPASNTTNNPNTTNSSTVSHNRGEVVTNTSLITFTLTISNPNKGMGIQYNDIRVTLYYQGASIGTRPVIPGFYQPHKKSLPRSVLVNAGPRFWTGIGNGNVALRVRLETGVRYRVIRWKTGKHRMDFEAFVGIDRQGRIEGEKDVKLYHVQS